MRHKRLKKFRKTVQFFRSCFGFHPPFRILVDGSFLSTILRNKIRAKELLEAALGAPARMVVTRSVVRELESIPGLEDALKMAQRLKVVTASDPASFDGFGDAPPTPVPDSLLQMVRADGNAQHFMVATQDAELRAALRKVPGVPLVYFQRVVLIVEPPSDASVRWAKENAGKNIRTGGGAIVESDEEDETEEVGDSHKRKRREKHPNPLSCLPKKRGKTGSARAAEGGGEKKSKVKRGRRGGQRRRERREARADERRQETTV